MSRQLLSLAAAVLLAAPAAADGPLAKVLKEGKDWERVPGKFKSLKWATTYYEGPFASMLDLWGEDAGKVGTVNHAGRAFPGLEKGVSLAKFGNRWVENHGLYVRIEPETRKAIVAVGNDIKHEVELPLKEIGDFHQVYKQDYFYVTDPSDKRVWILKATADKKLEKPAEFATLELPAGEGRSEALALENDSDGRVYVGCKTGVQVFDPKGKYLGTVPAPAEKRITGLAWGGPRNTYLYVVCGGELYRRQMTAEG
jgi:SMP-30/Gluconolactonase/LRE-like region